MTNHHAEAEKWLTEAADIWNEPRDHDDPPIDQLRIISRALVGIGHALLALAGHTFEIQAPNYVSDIRCGYRTPTGYRCVLIKPHTGIPHRTEVGQGA